MSFILFYSSAAFSATVNVSTTAELVNAIASASTPTEIVLASGNYGGGDIVLNNNTASVAIRSATDFEAHIQLNLKIYGDNITVQKRTFDGAAGEANIFGDDVKILKNIWNNYYYCDFEV